MLKYRVLWLLFFLLLSRSIEHPPPKLLGLPPDSPLNSNVKGTLTRVPIKTSSYDLVTVTHQSQKKKKKIDYVIHSNNKQPPNLPGPPTLLLSSPSPHPWTEIYILLVNIFFFVSLHRRRGSKPIWCQSWRPLKKNFFHQTTLPRNASSTIHW